MSVYREALAAFNDWRDDSCERLKQWSLVLNSIQLAKQMQVTTATVTFYGEAQIQAARQIERLIKEEWRGCTASIVEYFDSSSGPEKPRAQLVITLDESAARTEDAETQTQKQMKNG